MTLSWPLPLPSPAPLLRLFRPVWMLRKVGLPSVVVASLVLSRESMSWAPVVTLGEGALHWLVFVCLSAVLAVVLYVEILQDLTGSERLRLLPGFEEGIRSGLGVLALALGGAAGGVALHGGAKAVEALALASLTTALFPGLIYLQAWIDSFDLPLHWDLLALQAVLLAPAALVLFAPGLPAEIGTRHPWLLAGTLLAGSVALLLHRPLPGFPGAIPEASLEGGGGLASSTATPWPEQEGAGTVQGRAGSNPMAVATVRVEEGPLQGPQGMTGGRPRSIREVVPVMRTGLRSWWIEGASRSLARPAHFLGFDAVLSLAWVWMAIWFGNWLLVLPFAVLVRLGPLPRVLDSRFPAGRMERAWIAWAADLLQSWGHVLVIGAWVVLAALVAPERVAAASGPHPLFVLAALAAALPLQAPLELLAGGERPRSVGRGLLAAATATGLAFFLLLPALAALLLVAFALVPSATFLVYRRHFARCALGPLAE